MKHLLLLLLLPLMLFGCEGSIDITPKIGDISIIPTEYEVFNCTLNSVDTDCVYGVGQLTCNSADLFVYEFDTNAIFVNDDSSSAPCETTIRQRFVFSETDKPLYKL